jgi:hypothetical protein
MELADFASDSLVPQIAAHVASLLKKRKIRPPELNETSAVIGNFRQGIPAEHTNGIGAIIDAGWSVFKDKNFMSDKDDPERMRVINELVLKSVEVFEIERMIRRDTKKKHPKASHRRKKRI